MAYETEAVTNVPAQTPNTVQFEMREERVFAPYDNQAPRYSKPKTETLSPLEAAKENIGQSDLKQETEVTEPQTEDTVKLSPQIAALARKEQKFRMQSAQLEKERAALAAEKQELAQLRSMKDKLSAKDYSALDDVIDYNEYSQYQVNKANGADPVSDELKKLNSKLTELEKSSQDNIQKQFEAAVSERRIATKELISKSESFPRIKKANAHEAVVQHILDTWEHDSEELSVEQAAKEVEEILLERAKSWAALLEEEKKEEAQVEKKTLPPMKESLKTLTNQVTAGELKRPSKPLYLMSDSERWAEARKRAEEKLQSNNRR